MIYFLIFNIYFYFFFIKNYILYNLIKCKFDFFIIQSSIDGEKASNFEALHEKITGTEERLNDINEQTQKKFQIVKDNINKIQKQIEDERAKFDSYTEAKNNYVKVLENKINERLNQEIDLRKEIERRFSILIDDKFNALKIEISKESRNRYECIENLKTYLEVKIIIFNINILNINNRMIFLNYKVQLNLNKEKENKMMMQYQKKFQKKFLNYKIFVMKIKKQEKKQKKQFQKC